MAANKKTPSIRFNGFKEEWKEKELGELADFNPKSELPSQFEYVDLESVIGTKMINHRTEIKAIAPSRAQRLAKKGDLFYQTVRPYQKNNFLFELPFKDYVFSTGYAQLRPKIDGRLLLNIVQKNSFVENVLDKCTGTSYPVVSSTDLALIKISIPFNKEEQQKIGTYFKRLDDSIQLQEQELEKITNLKKAMLDKLFPTLNNNVPEIRFSGFSGNWEKKKLSDCLVTSIQKNNELKFSRNDVLSVSGEVGIVNQIEFQGRSFAGISVANYGVVKQGDIVYTKSPLKVNPYGIIKTNKGKDGIVSTLYAIYSVKENIDSNFVEYYFGLDKRLNNYLKPLVSKGAKNDMKVSDDNALKGTVIFPKEKIEQTKIADYFKNLDQLISQSQQKIQQLKHLKQALLQKMFI